MKYLILLFVLIIHQAIFSQPISGINKLDTASIVKKAKWRNAYWNNHHYYKPDISFSIVNCKWTVKSTKTKHSNRGDCKNTNGCTLIKTVTLVIDAQSRKVKSKAKTKKLIPNYE